MSAYFHLYRDTRITFGQGELAHAAFFLGAMAHYLGDVAQYGHAWPDETHHSDYEKWAAGLTSSFDAGIFEDAIDGDLLVRRTPYAAARRISRATFAGRPSDDILPAPRMDALFSTKPQEFIDSVRGSLNLGVNEIADVLHRFFINVVDEADD